MDSRPAPTLIYRLHPGVAYEGFDDGALVLRLDDRHLFELNLTARFVLAHTDGQQTVSQVAEAMAKEFEISQEEALSDLLVVYNHLASEEIAVARDSYHSSKQRLTMPEPRYIRNPDVGLREEDEDGALLFNPDTNQVLVLNTTGLSIWKLCDGKHSLDAIANALLSEFEGATVSSVTADVREFIENMTRSGFIGTAVTMDTSSAMRDA